MWAVYKKELKSYFINMTGYIVITLLLVFTGIFVTAVNLISGLAAFESSLGSTVIVYLFIIPILTMRSLADERRSRTDQLLYSLPIKVGSIVFGKYLAMLTVLAIPTLIICIYPVILSAFGIMYYQIAYTTILGFFLLGAALIALCMFMSSLTESQVLSAVISFGVLLLLYLMSSLTMLIPTAKLVSFIGFAALAVLFAVVVYLMTKNLNITLLVAAICIVPLSIFYYFKSASFEGLLPKLLEKLAVFDRFANFTLGMFDLTAIVYYLSIIALFVFLTVKAVEKRRWS